MFFDARARARRAAGARRPHAGRARAAAARARSRCCCPTRRAASRSPAGPSRSGSACACPRSTAPLAPLAGDALAGAPVERQPVGRRRRAPARGRGRRASARRVDLQLDGGELPGTPSTVVDLTATRRTGAYADRCARAPMTPAAASCGRRADARVATAGMESDDAAFIRRLHGCGKRPRPRVRACGLPPRRRARGLRLGHAGRRPGHGQARGAALVRRLVRRRLR